MTDSQIECTMKAQYYPYHPLLKYVSNNNLDIVFHHTGSKQADKILKEGFISGKYAEKRKAVFASGNTINEFYSRTCEGETFYGQSPVKIPIDIRNLKLFDATDYTPNSEIGAAIIHGDLSIIPNGYDGTIKFLGNGDIYEVALPAELATDRIFISNKLNEYFSSSENIDDEILNNLTERIKSYSKYIFLFPNDVINSQIKEVVLYVNNYKHDDEFKSSLLMRGDESGRIYLGEAGGTWITDNIDNAKTYGNSISYVIPPKNPLKMEISDAFIKYVDPELQDFSEATEDDWIKLRQGIMEDGYDALEITAPFDDAKDIWLFEQPALIMNADLLYNLAKKT